MRRILFGLLVAVLCLAQSGCRSTIHAKGTRPSATIEADGTIPAAAFFREPRLSHVRLSPDGLHIAGVMAKDNVELLIARRSTGGQVHALGKLERNIDRRSWTMNRVGWAGDSVLLASIQMPYSSWGGSRKTRLMHVELNGGEPRYLGEKWPNQHWTRSQDAVMSWMPENPDRILINVALSYGRGGVSARTVDMSTAASRGRSLSHLCMVRRPSP